VTEISAHSVGWRPSRGVTGWIVIAEVFSRFEEWPPKISPAADLKPIGGPRRPNAKTRESKQDAHRREESLNWGPKGPREASQTG
jgi:hypothetical protein